METKTDKIWNKSFLLLCGVFLFLSLCNQLMLTGIPLYIISIGGSEATCGYITAAFTLSALVMRVFSGGISDRFGRLTSAIAGCAVFAAASVAFGLFAPIALLFVLRAFHGFSYSLCGTALNSSLPSALPANRLREGVGYFGVGFAVATAIGPMLALEMIDAMEYKYVFIIVGGGLFATIAALVPLAGKDRVKSVRSSVSAFERSAVKPAVVQAVYSMVQAAVMFFAVLFGKEHGFSGVGAFFVVASVFMLAARLFGGRILSRFSVRGVVAAALVVAMVGVICMSLAKSNILYLTGAAIYGLTSSIIAPTLNSAAIAGVPNERCGAASATYYFGCDLGLGIGSAIWGNIAEFIGYSAMYASAAVVALAALVLTLVFFKKQNTESEQCPAA